LPTYQYECTACGHQFEEIQSFNDQPISICPKCQGEVKKVFGNVGVVFKGSGFYKTDSQSKKSDS
jgi:putative FmdB family regulatory protein